MIKTALLILIYVTLQSCASGHCRHLKNEEMKNSNTVPELKLTPVKTSTADRVRIYKFDGSLQCGMGQSKSLTEIKSELSSIHVYESWKRHDGVMRIQLCGSPTGQANVYEIDRKNLDFALKQGFKEWTLD